MSDELNPLRPAGDERHARSTPMQLLDERETKARRASGNGYFEIGKRMLSHIYKDSPLLSRNIRPAVDFVKKVL